MNRLLIAAFAAALAVGLWSSAGAAAPSARASGTSLAVIDPVKFNAPEFLADRKHGKPAIGLTAFQVAGLNGARVKVRCHGCGHARLRAKHVSKNVTRWTGARWWVFGNAYVEVDAWRDGTFGRWARLSVKVVSSTAGQQICYSLKKHGGPYACLVKVKTGCLLSLTGHSDCPPNTIVDQPFQVPNSPAPDTTITAGPSGLVNDRTVTFTYSSSGGKSYECMIDTDVWRVCPDGQMQYSGLPDAHHTFSVRAVGTSGQPDPTPATRQWNSDSTPPHTTITSGPSGPVQIGSATIAYTSSEPGARFDCDFDHQGFTPCNGGSKTVGFGIGNHSLGVRAVDAAGNADPNPPTASWTRYPDDGTTFTADDSDPAFSTFSGDSSSFQSASDPNAVNGQFTWFLACANSPGSRSVSWQVGNLPTGRYDVYVFIPAAPAGQTLAAQTTYTIFSRDADTDAPLSQATNAGSWALLTGASLSNTAVISLGDDDGQVGTCDTDAIEADGIRLVYRYFDGG